MNCPNCGLYMVEVKRIDKDVSDMEYMNLSSEEVNNLITTEYECFGCQFKQVKASDK